LTTEKVAAGNKSGLLIPRSLRTSLNSVKRSNAQGGKENKRETENRLVKKKRREGLEGPRSDQGDAGTKKLRAELALGGSVGGAYQLGDMGRGRLVEEVASSKKKKTGRTSKHQGGGGSSDKTSGSSGNYIGKKHFWGDMRDAIKVR